MSNDFENGDIDSRDIESSGMAPPVFGSDPAPDHGETFWQGLTAELEADFPAPAIGEPTVELPVPASPAASPNRYRPLMAAAALLLIVGIGAVALQNRGDRTADLVLSQELPVAGEGPLDGPDGSQGGTQAESADPAGDISSIPAVPTAGEVEAAVDVQEPYRFVLALGADDRTVYEPLAGSGLDDGRFLATWQSRRLSWFSIDDGAGDCGRGRYSQILWVNEARLGQLLHDPQIYFSGDVDYFRLSTDETQAAWVVSCGPQIELHVAQLVETGEVGSSRLAWFGQGDIANAETVWNGDRVTLRASSIEGEPFSVTYDTSSGNVSAEGLTNLASTETHGPRGRDGSPVGANTDASLSYWIAPDENGMTGCSSATDTLWLRAERGSLDRSEWLPAFVDDIDLGQVTAFALDAASGRIAIAGGCDGATGKVYIGTQGVDGRIGNVQVVDLAPYVPGVADRLYWVGGDTLRIETDNRAFSALREEFDYLVDESLIIQRND